VGFGTPSFGQKPIDNREEGVPGKYSYDGSRGTCKLIEVP